MSRIVQLLLCVCLAFSLRVPFSTASRQDPIPTPTALEIITTPGGLQVRFPAALFAMIDRGSPNTLTLTNLDPASPLKTVRIEDAWDAWGDAATPTMDNVREHVLNILRLVGRPLEDSPQFALPNGALVLVPYVLDSGGAGLYAILEVTNGRVIVAEMIVEDQVTLSQLLENPQPWIEILSSITFVEASSHMEVLPQLALPDRPLMLSEMPQDTIIFASDVMLRLTSPWALSSVDQGDAAKTVDNTVTLAYNRAEALATIQVDSMSGTSFIDWRESLLGIMSSALTAGGEAPEGVAYLRPDSRALEQFVSPDLALSLTFVELGGDQAAYVLMTMIETQEARRQEIIDSLRAILLTMTRFERTAPITDARPG